MLLWVRPRGEDGDIVPIYISNLGKIDVGATHAQFEDGFVRIPDNPSMRRHAEAMLVWCESKDRHYFWLVAWQHKGNTSFQVRKADIV